MSVISHTTSGRTTPADLLEYDVSYRSSIGPRVSHAGHAFNNSSNDRNTGGRTLKMVTEMGSSAFGISPAMMDAGAKSFLQTAEREKKEMQGLNDRLGNYIGRVKSLEDRNRQLVGDLEEMRSKWGQDTSEIKLRYGDELRDARTELDDGSKRRGELDVKFHRLKDDISEYRTLYDQAVNDLERNTTRINMVTQQVADSENDADMLRRQLDSLQKEKDRYTTDNVGLRDVLDQTRGNLDEEATNRLDYQNRVQSLMEELEFLRRVHDQEVKELQALLNTQPADTREFFKNELALAIRDIKGEYDHIAVQNKADMENWYKLKVTEVQHSVNRAQPDGNVQRQEVHRLRDNIGDARDKLGDYEAKNSLLERQVADLRHHLDDDQRQYEDALNDRDGQLRKMRDECSMLVSELQSLLDTKQYLDSEIAIYRTMLQGEETRANLHSMVESAVKTHSLQQQETTDSTKSVRGEQTSRTTFQRSAKGNMVIAEADPEGKFILIENQHRSKEENISQWKLKRRLDGKKELLFTFPADTLIKAGESCKIWARVAEAVSHPPTEHIFEGEDSWGTAAASQTFLINKDNEERATYTQRTVPVQ
jgi:intermediate filament protein if